MCGIVGIAGGNPRRENLESMIALIRHRGPDGEGLHVTADVGLGNVRLAIVDPSSAGSQPMLTPDGRYSLVYNGELFNHMEFRQELEAGGVSFRGHSDTETLLWLLVRHGKNILSKLNGIFAFAFHDSREGTLLLARDQMGVKPLYYAYGRGSRLIFASEIKALFATGEVEPRINRDDILELFMFHFIAGDRTAFNDIHELLPGHVLEYSRGRTSLKQFWSPVPISVDEDGGADCEVLRHMLRSGVRRQLMADVPVGIMSSGGLDSGIVTAFASGQDGPMSGFCFRDQYHKYDELHEAGAIAESFAVNLQEVGIAEAEIPELLMKLTWYYDEPLPRPHHLAAYAVARQARSSGLKVLLSGEGGDELFGGYSRYVELTAALNGSFDSSAIVFAHNRVAVPRIARFWPWRYFLNSYRFWCAQETNGLDLINRQLIVDQKTFLQHFLQRSDRMGMAEGVEIRVPLLDIPLVEYVNSLPGWAKVSCGETKVCLKSVAKGVLPSKVIDRPKQPFDMPMAPLLQGGPVARFLDDMLLSKPRCGELFDSGAIEALVRDLRTGQEDLWKVAWLLLTTEVWMRTFKVAV
jgi:asparagine synthase (glutamine-hydrolysing)